MKDWVRVTYEDGKVILDIFPYQPGGSTLYLSVEEAIWLARLLHEAALLHSGEKE